MFAGASCRASCAFIFLICRRTITKQTIPTMIIPMRTKSTYTSRPGTVDVRLTKLRTPGSHMSRQSHGHQSKPLRLSVFLNLVLQSNFLALR